MTLDRSIPRDSWPTEAIDPLRDLEAGSRRAKRNGKSEKGEAGGRKEDRSREGRTEWTGEEEATKERERELRGKREGCTKSLESPRNGRSSRRLEVMKS